MKLVYPFFLTKRQAYFFLYRQSKRKQDLMRPSSSPFSIRATLHRGSLQHDIAQSLLRSTFGADRNVAPSFTDKSVSRTKSSFPVWNREKQASPPSWPEAEFNSRSRKANAPDSIRKFMIRVLWRFPPSPQYNPDVTYKQNEVDHRRKCVKSYKQTKFYLCAPNFP